MTSSIVGPIKVLVLYTVVACVSTLPLSGIDRTDDVFTHVASTTADEYHEYLRSFPRVSTPPTTATDGVTLLRRVLIGIYRDEVNALRSRLKSNMDAIEEAIRRRSAAWQETFGSVPTVQRRSKGPPVVIGQGTNLNLYVLSQKLTQLQYEQSMRNIERNAETFETYG